MIARVDDSESSTFRHLGRGGPQPDHDPGDEHVELRRIEVVFATHWQCEACFCRCYYLVEYGEDRLSWCFGCYDEQGNKRGDP